VGRALGVVGTLLLPCCLLRAQAGAIVPAPQSSKGRLPVTGCAGQIISNIVVITQPPYTDKLPARLEFVRRAARAVHSTTRDDIIRRYLLLDVGEPCNQIRRAESERILRAQPFLVDARILVYDDEAGGVRLDVETRDEFSLLAGGDFSPPKPFLHGLRIGDNNLGGSGIAAAVDWHDAPNYHSILGFELTDYQFARGRQIFRLSGTRFERGQELRAEVVHPYFTDLQRFGWIASIGGTRDYTDLLRPREMPNSVNVTRQFADVGALIRVGPVGRLKLLGLAITRETERADSVAVRITDDGFRPDSGAPLRAAFRPQNVVRLNGLLGLRRIGFQRVQGFDALNGAQDVRVGMEAGFIFGQSMQIGDARDRDRFVGGSIYAGVGGAKSFGGLQLQSEARYDRTAHLWDNMVSSGRMAWYFHPAEKQLTLLSGEWSSIRSMGVPAQLSMADFLGGLHAHARSREPGAARLVFRGEQRLIIPTRYNVADAGLAVFAEAGRLWRDPSVPYSVDTPWRGAVGVSVLAAVPPRSRRLFRMDLAFPISNDRDRRFEVRFIADDLTRMFWREPWDVEPARERTVPKSLFRWP
jgi:hypothetical protein